VKQTTTPKEEEQMTTDTTLVNGLQALGGEWDPADAR